MNTKPSNRRKERASFRLFTRPQQWKLRKIEEEVNERRRLQRGELPFQTCFRCKGTNTDKIACSDTEYYMCYIGWCFDCREDYGYNIRIETVRDKKGRL